MNLLICWRIKDSPNAWWLLRLLSQNLTGLFFTSALKYLHSVPEVGLVKMYMRTREPQIPINAKWPGLQNVKSAGLQAHGCIGGVPGSCVPALLGLSSVPAILSRMAAPALAPFLLGHSGRDLSPHLHKELLKDSQTECNEYPGLTRFWKLFD